MNTHKAKGDFRFYLYGVPSQRKLLLVLCPIAFLLGLFSIVLWSVLVQGLPASFFVLRWPIMASTLEILWVPSFYAWLRCYGDFFRFRDGYFETEVFFRKKCRCRQEEAISFGQTSENSIGLFAKDGTLVLNVPFGDNYDTTKEFLLQIRHVLIHQGLVEISQEEADKTLQRKEP